MRGKRQPTRDTGSLLMCPFYTAPLAEDRRKTTIRVGLRLAPSTCVPVVAIRATGIPPIQLLERGFPEAVTGGLIVDRVGSLSALAMS